MSEYLLNHYVISSGKEGEENRLMFTILGIGFCLERG